MGIDPLSSATRAAKRNLLIVSLLTITFRACQISIDKIPFSGLTINFDPGVFAFLLAALLFYFLVTFLLTTTLTSATSNRLHMRD